MGLSTEESEDWVLGESLAHLDTDCSPDHKTICEMVHSLLESCQIY